MERPSETFSRPVGHPPCPENKGLCLPRGRFECIYHVDPLDLLDVLPSLVWPHLQEQQGQSGLDRGAAGGGGGSRSFRLVGFNVLDHKSWLKAIVRSSREHTAAILCCVPPTKSCSPRAPVPKADRWWLTPGAQESAAKGVRDFLGDGTLCRSGVWVCLGGRLEDPRPARSQRARSTARVLRLGLDFIKCRPWVSQGLAGPDAGFHNRASHRPPCLAGRGLLSFRGVLGVLSWEQLVLDPEVTRMRV